MPASVQVTVEAITAGAQKSIDSVQSEITKVGIAATVAANRVAELANEIGDVGRRAIAASFSITALGVAAGLAAGGFIALGSALLPLIGILAPLGLALGGIVGAFGLIIGSGILAWGKGFGKTMARVKKEVTAMVKEFGQQFVPLIKTAVRAIPSFVRAILNAIGPLDSFVAALRKIGGIAFRVIPRLIALAFDLGRAILPVFMKIVTAILQNVVPVFNRLARIGRSLSDEFLFLGNMIVKAIPPLFKLGTVVLRTVVGALVRLVKVAGRVGRAIVQFGKQVLGIRTPAQAAKRSITLFENAIAGLRKTGQVAIRALRRAFNAIKPILQTVVRQFRQNRKSIGKSIRQTKAVVVGVIRTLRTQVTKLIGNITQIWGRFWRRNKKNILGITRTLTKLIISIVRRVTGTMLKLWRNHGKKTFRTIRKYYEQVHRSISTFVSIALQIIRPFLNRLRKFWKRNGEDIMFIVRALVGTLLTLFRKLMQVVTTVIRTGTKAIRFIWERWGHSIKAYAKFVFDGIFSIIGAVIDSIASVIRAGLKLMKGDWKGALNIMKGLVSRIFNGILNYVGKWGDNVVRAIQWVVDNVVKWFQNLYHDLIGGSIIPNMLRDILRAVTSWDIVGTFRRVIKNVLSMLRGLIGDFLSLGEKFLKAVVRGVGNIAGNLVRATKNAARDAANGLINTFNRILPNQINIPQVSIGGGSIDIPSVTIAGKTIGGGSLNVPRLSIGGQNIRIPQLQTGGFIEEAGLAFLHANEQVVPAAEVNRSRTIDSGSEVTDVTNTFDITVHADSDDDGRDMAKMIADELRSRNYNS